MTCRRLIDMFQQQARITPTLLSRPHKQSAAKLIRAWGAADMAVGPTRSWKPKQKAILKSGNMCNGG